MSTFTQLPLASTDEDAYLAGSAAMAQTAVRTAPTKVSAVLLEYFDIAIELNSFTSNKRIYCLYIVVLR